MTAPQRIATADDRRPEIAADRLAAIGLLESRIVSVAARTRGGLRGAASAVHPDLQPLAVVLLRDIEHRGEATAGALARRLQVDKSVISRQLRHLEGLGLVAISTMAADRRHRGISLTPAAVEQLAALGNGLAIRFAERLGAWETSDLTRFAAYLKQLLDDTDEVPGLENSEDQK